MEPADWIAEAKKHQSAIAELIRNYHPRSVVGNRTPMPITAPGPEAACDAVRAKIRSDGEDLPDPVHTFNTAVDGGDHEAACIDRLPPDRVSRGLEVARRQHARRPDLDPGSISTSWIALQAVLGSDPIRELLSLVRVENDCQDPIALFRPRNHPHKGGSECP